MAIAEPCAVKQGNRPRMRLSECESAAAEEKRGGTVLIASGDRDTFQLASDRTTILYPVRAGERARVGPAEVRMRYGVEPG